jgi:hypothetical protein
VGMSAATSDERARVVHLLREALGTVCTPDVRERILGDALARARASEIPSSRDRLPGFIQGPFRQVVEERIGSAVADAVIRELQELITGRAPAANEQSAREAFESHPRLKQERIDTIAPATSKVKSPAPLAPGVRWPAVRARVWIATLDRDGVGRIASRLDADLHMVRHVDEIEPGGSDGTPSAVIVDLRASVDWKYALFGLGGRLPPGIPVILWGGDLSSVDVLNVCRPNVTWLSCGAKHSPEQLVETIRDALAEVATRASSPGR